MVSNSFDYCKQGRAQQDLLQAKLHPQNACLQPLAWNPQPLLPGLCRREGDLQRHRHRPAAWLGLKGS